MIPTFDTGVLQGVANILGDTDRGLTSGEIGNLLQECHIPDPLSGSTKRYRLFVALRDKQETDRCGNNIVHFIQHVMNPARHYNQQEWFDDTCAALNSVLVFDGYQLGRNGKLVRSQKAQTHSEAYARASRLREGLILRKVHPDVLLFCREELLVDNYFHSVFEATKSVAEKIRQKTGLTSDGASLVDDAFSFKSGIPHLALNSLQTESEQNEQKGFMNLLKGLFGTFRNTTAHAPKITWKIEEQDALDILSLVSLIHRRLDQAVSARKLYEGLP